MNATAPTRIVLGLQPGDSGEDCIHIASRLAHAMRAAIHALLVEEQTVMDAAALPFTRIVARSGQTVPEFTPQSMEKAASLAERRFRRALSVEAQPVSIPWSVQRQRGELAAALSACASSSDIVMLPGAAARQPSRLPMVRGMASRVRGVVIVRRQPAPVNNASAPVVVLDEGSPGGTAALALAAQFAAGMDRTLHVLVVADSTFDAEAIEQRVRHLAMQARHVHVHRLPAGRGDAMKARLAGLGAALVVASIDTPALASDAAIIELQRASGAPLLLAGKPGQLEG
jgi:hypothetical protein